KAGLLAMTAAWLTRVPVRVHTFTGQVWATRRGPSRVALKAIDRLVAGAATLAMADSPSQRDFLIEQGVARPSKLIVPGNGSVSGVDGMRFRPSSVLGWDYRERFGIPASHTLILFMGRLHRDKGVLDLARAFAALAGERPDLRLLMVGPDEQGLRREIEGICGSCLARLHFDGFTTTPEAAMAAADILCLPSYREGFGSVIIEAAAAGVPSVASRIYGVVDAIEEGRTGLLHEAGDVDGLIDCLRRLAADPGLRTTLGGAARDRALRDFSQDSLTSKVLDVYARLLEGTADRRPATVDAHPDQATRATGWYGRFGKRAFDIVGASLGLVLLLPVTLATALLVRLSLGSPVLYRHERPGLHGLPFVMLKFRSMVERVDADGRPLPDGDRLTPVGRFLRSSSLDEIPELWNVLRGDMSLVGPRPLLMEYLPLYTADQARRHQVRPGITGLAQVNGRNGLSWEERFQLDLRYVENRSFAWDLAILARTAREVISCRGINQPGRATVDYFRGDVRSNG
ncbi:MAG TPA: sugar transferase, partial [Vicinamibacterales bacterium]|nr:sugar transferase [Vicinamibacterales bacterium]